MQVDHTNNLNLDGDSNEIAKATIAEEDLPFIIDLVSRQMYRDPIGSIVREITSNCFDAHIEAGINDPVEISMGRDELGKYISFKDVGVGMSPDLMENTFLSYGKSPKRASNNFIGGFGLGGKSPLAYTTQFYITTIHNGILYEYIIHKGERLPTIELLSEETTESRNGTTVKIYINTGEESDGFYVERTDSDKFINACTNQLVYFDNVYFGQSMNIRNDYKIYEGEHFKLRSDVEDDDMHLCIGKVKYPIDWRAIGKDPIGIPVGLKFEIGDLIVTPERESVRYIKVNGVETAEIIAKKVDLVVEELKQRYYKVGLVHTTSIFKYLELRRQDPILTIGNLSLKIGQITKVNVVCTPLEGFPGTIKNDVTECWSFDYDIYKSHGKGKRKLSRHLTRDWVNIYKSNLYLIKGKVKPEKNSYLFTKVDSLYVGKLSVSNIQLHRALGLNKLSHIEVGTIGWLNKIRELIESEIRVNFKDYEAVIVPKEHKSVFAKASRKEDEIVVYDMTEDKVIDRKKYMNPKQFETYTGFIIFAFEEDEDLLLNMLQLFKRSRYDVGNNNFRNSKVVAFLKISNVNFKYLRKLKHAVHVSDFIGNNKVFKHFATTLIMKKEARYNDLETSAVKGNGAPLSELMPYIHSDYLDDFKSVCKHIKDYPAELGAYGKREEDEKAFAESIISVARKYNLIDEDVYNKHTRLNNYVSKLELLYETDISFSILHLIVDFLVLKGKRVYSIWNKPQTYEVELLKESIDRIQYIESCFILDSNQTRNKKIFNSILTYHNYVTNNA